MEKRTQTAPSEDEIRLALAAYTAPPVPPERMWEKIAAELDAEPLSQWRKLRPWLAFGSVAALVCLIIILNWSSPVPSPQSLPETGPQIMRFSAFAPLTAQASVKDEKLAVQLTAASPVQFSSAPAEVRIIELDQTEITAATVTDLAHIQLSPGETHVLYLDIPLPTRPGSYQVQLELEIETADGLQTINVFAPFNIHGED